MAKQSSNKGRNWVIGIIVIVLVSFGGYKVWHHYSKGATMQSSNTPTANNSVSQTPSQGNQTTGNSGLSNKTDTSNQQLQQDTQSIQNSMNQLQQDQSTSGQDTTNQSLDVPQP